MALSISELAKDIDKQQMCTLEREFERMVHVVAAPEIRTRVGSSRVNFDQGGLS